jgi:hypothetical protein
MNNTSTVFSPIAGPSAQETEIRARRKLLLAYADERVQRLPLRLARYLIGCSIGYYAVELLPVLLSLAILLAGDIVDCLLLRTYVRREALVGSLKRGQRCATLTSALQGLSVVAGVSVYYFKLGDEANILFVIGALGLGGGERSDCAAKEPGSGIHAVVLLPRGPVHLRGIAGALGRKLDAVCHDGCGRHHAGVLYAVYVPGVHQVRHEQLSLHAGFGAAKI